MMIDHYITIITDYEHQPRPPKFTQLWRNFIWNGYDADRSVDDRIIDWNGKIINDVVVFETEKDKMWFILRWS